MAGTMVVAKNIQQWFHQEIEQAASKIAGGRARLTVIVLMACVLALDSADKATVGAIAVQLKQALNIGNVEIGLLVTASTGIGALATLPIGILTDRINRTRMLAISIVLWSITMVISGFSTSYMMLLLSRLALGAVIATAYPVITSITGDYFRPGERGHVWGYVLSGEMFGAGFGILISGEVATFLSWRYSFWVLAAISLILAVAVWCWLPEPVRGLQSYLHEDQEKIPSVTEGKESDEVQKQQDEKDSKDDNVKRAIEKDSINPHKDHVLTSDPADMPIGEAVRYILSIRTNVLLIIASACGYFFFTGLRTFAVVYLRGRFDLGQGMGKLTLVTLGLGAIVGVFLTGRFADRLIERGHQHARITVAAAAFFITAAFFYSAFYMTSLYIAAPLFFMAAIGLGGTNAPLDAARLDIMHSRLWGRAESVRTTLRYTFEALAPIIFGWVSTLFGSQNGFFSENAAGGSGSIMPLTYTFRLMLIPVIIASIVLYWARKTYPRDVATVLASEKDTNN